MYNALPHAGINPGGDCGPACIAPIIGISIREFYDTYHPSFEAMAYCDVYSILWRLKHEGKIKHLDNSLPANSKLFNPEYMAFGNPSWENFISWSNKADYEIRHGYIGLAQVNNNGNAAGDMKHQFMVNHWVLINGFTLAERSPDSRVHISCSNHGQYEKTPIEFLMNYGGYNTIWVLPK